VNTGSYIERFRHAALPCVAGRSYGHTGDATQDCVRLAFAILVLIFGASGIGPLSKALHLNGFPLGSFANAQALVDNGYGWFEPSPFPGGIFYCQGWRGNKGHCFFIIWGANPGDRPWILEATNSDRDMDGDGVADKYDWYREVVWADQAAKYTELRAVQLRDPQSPQA